MIFEAFSSARNSILLLSPCKMANIFRIVAYWDSTFYHRKKETKVGRKTGFPCPETSPVWRISFIFSNRFFGQTICAPVVSLKASLFLLLAQAGESQTVFFCANKKKGGPPQTVKFCLGHISREWTKKIPSDVGDSIPKNSWEMSGKRP